MNSIDTILIVIYLLQSGTAIDVPEYFLHEFAKANARTSLNYICDPNNMLVR